MRYREAVAEAKQLRKRSEADQWRLAELTWEQTKRDGVATRKWADDVGVSQPYVVKLAQIWEAHGDNPVIARPAFADAYAEARGLPLERSDRRVREAAATLRKASLEDRATVIGEVLGSSEGADVMEKVLDGSIQAGANISRASERVRDRQEKATDRRNRERFPGLIRNGHLVDAESQIGHARRDLEDAIANVQAAIPLAPDEVESLEDRIASTRNRLDALAGVVASATKTLEEQAADLGR